MDTNGREEGLTIWIIWTKLPASTSGASSPHKKRGKPLGLSRFLHFGVLLASSDHATNNRSLHLLAHSSSHCDDIANHAHLRIGQPVQVVPKLAAETIYVGRRRMRNREVSLREQQGIVQTCVFVFRKPQTR